MAECEMTFAQRGGSGKKESWSGFKAILEKLLHVAAAIEKWRQPARAHFWVNPTRILGLSKL
jgi:hypothetical protein